MDYKLINSNLLIPLIIQTMYHLQPHKPAHKEFFRLFYYIHSLRFICEDNFRIVMPALRMLLANVTYHSFLYRIFKT